MPGRPVAARANFIAASVDSAPEFAKNTLSRCGTSARSRSARIDRKSTRLNSSHDQISYAVFCLKKKKSLEPTKQLVATAPDYRVHALDYLDRLRRLGQRRLELALRLMIEPPCYRLAVFL